MASVPRRVDELRGVWERQDRLVRRASIVGVIVVVVALVAILVGRIVGSESDAPTVMASDSWNAVVAVTDREVRLITPATGEVLQAYPIGDDLLDQIGATGGRTLVLLATGGALTQVDLTDGDTTTARSAPDSELSVSGDNPLIMDATPTEGGELTVVDTRSQRALALGLTAELTEPLFFSDDLRVNPSGSHAAVSDRESFQTVLMDLGEQTTSLLGGQAAAINDTTVVTVQRAGDMAELDFYDLTADRKGTVDVPSPAAIMLTSQDEVVSVTDDGRVFSVSSSGRVERRESLGDDGGTARVRRGLPALGDTRLVVQTADGVRIVDADGTLVAAVAGRIVGEVTRSSRCVDVGDGSTTGRSTLVDLDTGDRLIERRGGIVGASSLDGCTVSILGGADASVVRDGLPVDVGVPVETITAISPDGRAAISTTRSGAQLIDLDGGEPVELFRGTAELHFADVP